MVSSGTGQMETRISAVYRFSASVTAFEGIDLDSLHYLTLDEVEGSTYDENAQHTNNKVPVCARQCHVFSLEQTGSRVHHGHT